MEKINFILIVALAVVCYFIYQEIDRHKHNMDTIIELQQSVDELNQIHRGVDKKFH